MKHIACNMLQLQHATESGPHKCNTAARSVGGRMIMGSIKWRYATPVGDDLEWLFHVLKIRFGQQGCRALTFALARLSCLTVAGS